jgi:hypothetical protein
MGGKEDRLKGMRLKAEGREAEGSVFSLNTCFLFLQPSVFSLKAFFVPSVFGLNP